MGEPNRAAKTEDAKYIYNKVVDEEPVAAAVLTSKSDHLEC